MSTFYPPVQSPPGPLPPGGQQFATMPPPSTVPMQGPTYAAPPAVQTMDRNYALEQLEQVDGLMIRQRLQILEEICSCLERRNMYPIKALPPGLRHKKRPTDEEFKQAMDILDAREQSDPCCRFFCGKFREFTIGVFPAGTPENPKWPTSVQPALQLHRPFKCTCIFCCFICCPQEITATAGNQYIGKVVQDWRCLDAFYCCRHWTKAFDSQGIPVYSIRTPLCGTNCCAPSCLNHNFKVFVLDGNFEQNVVGRFRNVWPGCNCRGCFCSGSADNYIVEFPEKATSEQKALLTAALFLNDFMWFENQGEE